MAQKKPPPDMEYVTSELPQDSAHWRVAFDSRFLRHYWLAGKPRIVTIADVKMLKSTSDSAKESKSQLLIILAEADKPWAANVTNCDLIEMVLGTSNPREWVGKQVELYPTKTRFGREVVDCIRVRDKRPEPRDTSGESMKQTARRDAHVDARPEARPTPSSPTTAVVLSYLNTMKEATNAEQLGFIEDKLAEDNTLSPEETQYLIRALKKRESQVTT